MKLVFKKLTLVSETLGYYSALSKKVFIFFSLLNIFIEEDISVIYYYVKSFR